MATEAPKERAAHAATLAPKVSTGNPSEVKKGDVVISHIGTTHDPDTGYQYTSGLTEVVKPSVWLNSQVAAGKFSLKG